MKKNDWGTPVRARGRGWRGGTPVLAGLPLLPPSRTWDRTLKRTSDRTRRYPNTLPLPRNDLGPDNGVSSPLEMTWDQKLRVLSFPFPPWWTDKLKHCMRVCRIIVVIFSNDTNLICPLLVVR